MCFLNIDRLDIIYNDIYLVEISILYTVYIKSVSMAINRVYKNSFFVEMSLLGIEQGLHKKTRGGGYTSWKRRKKRCSIRQCG